MFAVFSLIEGIPMIHKNYVSEETTQKALGDFVIHYIQQGRKEDKENLTLPLADIKIDTYTSYPVRTYLPIDPSMIEIYEHSLSDKVEKGWVWNGTLKVVESKKVGYFQVIRVSDPVIEDHREYKPLSSEMDDLIQEIMNEISDTRISLEKDIEDVKKLQFDAQKYLEPCPEPCPVLRSMDIPYIKIEYPSQPTYVDEFNKKDLRSFEEKYLPFFDECKEEQEEHREEEQGNEERREERSEQEESIEDEIRSDDNNNIFQRSRRGSRRSPHGRANYGMRKMRLRSY